MSGRGGGGYPRWEKGRPASRRIWDRRSLPRCVSFRGIRARYESLDRSVNPNVSARAHGSAERQTGFACSIRACGVHETPVRHGGDVLFPRRSPMTGIVVRLRAAVRSLGNDGALANVVTELHQAAAARAAVAQLEQRFAVAAPLPDAA